MKEIKLYCCEICRTKYDDEEKAKACEKSHKIPAMCEGKSWKALNEPESVIVKGFPEFVIVEFKDGSQAEYAFAGRLDQ